MNPGACAIVKIALRSPPIRQPFPGVVFDRSCGCRYEILHVQNSTSDTTPETTTSIAACVHHIGLAAREKPDRTTEECLPGRQTPTKVFIGRIPPNERLGASFYH
jgi:hypothetical protein